MADFFRLARTVSRTTYQERLLDAGLPDSAEFCEEMERLAQQDCVRAFLLFHQDRPVSYLYCPISNGVVLYAYLGYDPDYMNFSVGTILQWLALEYLFDEKIFRLFDFTEGQSEHKKLFATNSIQCANVFFLRMSLSNAMIVCSREVAERASRLIGGVLDQLGWKASVRRLMRFGK
jgi:CelD/BcsL family acetyltransferase involved in cellulose biosynthesis